MNEADITKSQAWEVSLVKYFASHSALPACSEHVDEVSNCPQPCQLIWRGQATIQGLPRPRPLPLQFIQTVKSAKRLASSGEASGVRSMTCRIAEGTRHCPSCAEASGLLTDLRGRAHRSKKLPEKLEGSCGEVVHIPSKALEVDMCSALIDGLFNARADSVCSCLVALI